MTDQKQLSEEQQSAWIKQQYQEATKYLATKGIITASVAAENSRYLVPMVAIWSLKDNNSQQYWVINGDLPADHVNLNAAKSAREAMRHFSMKWQLQAEGLLKSNDEKQVEFGRLLVGRAEGLYQIYNDEKLWQAEKLNA